MDDNYWCQFCRRHKIFCVWKVLDQHQGQFGGKGLTRNMMDIKVAVHSVNLWCFERSLFSTSNRQCGDQESLMGYLILKNVGVLLISVILKNNPSKLNFQRNK